MTEDVSTANTGLYNLLYFVTEKVKLHFPRDRKSKGPFTLSVSDAVRVSGHRQEWVSYPFLSEIFHHFSASPMITLLLRAQCERNLKVF